VGAPPGRSTFHVYVEGPRDRAILERWAQRISPRFGRAVGDVSVILGGRQPARAAAHLRQQRSRDAGAQGLCVLDGDAGAVPAVPEEPGLELFTWSRRHIESYVLVPRAIRAALRMPGHLEHTLREILPDPGDEPALRSLDAKQVLGPKGPLARLLGRPVEASLVARAMRVEEFHPEIHSLFDRIRVGLAFSETTVEVRLAR
jgi:hypothetical protein